MIEKILKQAWDFKFQISDLKMNSPKWPELLAIMIGNDFYVSTMVHFFYNGVEFSRHHAECSNKAHWYSDAEWSDIKAATIRRIDAAVELAKAYAVPCCLDDVIGIVNENNNDKSK